MASIALELLFRNNEKNQCGGRYFEFHEPRANASRKRNKQELEKVSRTEESDVVPPTATFRVIDLKNFDSADKKKHYIQVNHVIEKPMIYKTEAESSRRPNSSSYLIWKRKITELRLIQNCYNCSRVWATTKKRALEEVSPVSSEHTECFGLLFAGYKTINPGEVKTQLVEALQFQHPGRTKKLADREIFQWYGMGKYIKKSVVHALYVWVLVRVWNTNCCWPKKSIYRNWPNLDKNYKLIFQWTT